MCIIIRVNVYFYSGSIGFCKDYTVSYHVIMLFFFLGVLEEISLGGGNDVSRDRIHSS